MALYHDTIVIYMSHVQLSVLPLHLPLMTPQFTSAPTSHVVRLMVPVPHPIQLPIVLTNIIPENFLLPSILSSFSFSTICAPTPPPGPRAPQPAPPRRAPIPAPQRHAPAPAPPGHAPAPAPPRCHVSKWFGDKTDSHSAKRSEKIDVNPSTR
ncbi:hypothetical protein C8J57DRAFT_1232927 [Mycena rebaudengoi]|nr:hypothetical protein C8J57DRAFT_1232927 [Mycena rebaudengoi]